jgi:putative intracellular protease/amidase
MLTSSDRLDGRDPSGQSWWSMTDESDAAAFDPDELWRPPADTDGATDDAPGPGDPVVYVEPPPRTDRRIVAFVTMQGLITEEHDIFRTVLGHLPGIEPLNVGHRLGPVAGPGGSRTVEATFDQVADPDIVVVPGALGSRQMARDPVLRRWLHDVAPRCRWIAASSTGSVVLAAAGLLNGHPAATHWLAGDLLAEFGSDIANQRLNVDAERVITATGSSTAFEAAYLVIQRELGDAEANRVRELVGSQSEDAPATDAHRGRRILRRRTG